MACELSNFKIVNIASGSERVTALEVEFVDKVMIATSRSRQTAKRLGVCSSMPLAASSIITALGQSRRSGCSSIRFGCGRHAARRSRERPHRVGAGRYMMRAGRLGNAAGDDPSSLFVSHLILSSTNICCFSIRLPHCSDSTQHG
jgi:hypothetical protein